MSSDSLSLHVYELGSFAVKQKPLIDSHINDFKIILIQRKSISVQKLCHSKEYILSLELNEAQHCCMSV